MQHRIIELGKNKIDFLDTFLVILLVIWSCPGALFRPKLMYNWHDFGRGNRFMRNGYGWRQEWINNYRSARMII